jgi:Zn-finger nucleic acid-binding protein
MKCPACFNPLKEIQVGNLKVDVCQGGCGGIWFDAFELERVDEENEAAGEPLLHIQGDEDIVVDSSRKRDCPRCAGIKLHRHFFSAKRRIEVDQCPGCGGYWLDAGELEQIRTERSETARTQQQVRESALSAADIRYLYGLRSRKSDQA